jgi:uncharacterized protein DUF1844
MEHDDEPRRAFQVKDRRRFSETGEARPEAPEEQQPAPSAPATEASEAAPGGGEPVTFSSFLLGLSTQALLSLGEVPDPATGKPTRDLSAAKHLIDLLGVLREKTRNNLDAGEESLFDSVLYDLRMRYVELVRRGTKEAK